MLNNTAGVQAAPQAGILVRGWRLFVDQLIQKVPELIAPCEFDCRKTKCTPDEWLSCERRLRDMRPTAPTPV